MTEKMLIRYQLVLKEDENITSPDFESFECCKEIGLCQAIFEAGKFYSRSEIETISSRLGYSVWDRGGSIELECKCKWKSFVVTPK